MAGDNDNSDSVMVDIATSLSVRQSLMMYLPDTQNAVIEFCSHTDDVERHRNTRILHSFVRFHYRQFTLSLQQTQSGWSE